jgi:uridine phosphorylase
MESAELILSPNGRIYHLDLLPKEISPTIILVGDPGRVGQVSKKFDKILFQRIHREFITHTGIIGDIPISVVSTGIGTDNIDIVINELDALVNIDLPTGKIKEKHTTLNLIRIGTSGSLHPSIPLDSFLINTHSLGLDNLLSYYDFEENTSLKALEFKILTKYPALGTLPIKPYLTGADNSLVQLFGKGMQKGITLTAPGFYGPQGRQLRLKSRMRNLLDTIAISEREETSITNFEMETSGIYGLSTLLNHKAISCNVILANRPQNIFSKQANESIENLIDYVLTQLSNNKK